MSFIPHKNFFVVILASAILFLFSCSDNITNNNYQKTYIEILSVNAGGYTVRLYVSGQDSLTTGYNEIFFKASFNSQPLSNGRISFFPKMWMTPSYAHSTPVRDTFYFEQSSGYFKGYAIFNMPTSPPDVIWWGFIRYLDENFSVHSFDSAAMFVSYHAEKQWRLFLDTTDQSTYVLSLLKPFSPVTGLNDFHLMLHKTDVQLYYHEQINDAEMFLKVYKINSGIPSSGNVNPLPGNDGIYKGRVNFSESGEWKVMDSIKYQGRFITGRPLPNPDFYFDLY